MRITRLYQPTDLTSTLTLNDIATHHLQVLRTSVGDICHVFDGQGKEAAYRITHCQKKTITLEKIHEVTNQTESSIQIDLYQALVKGDKMDWVIQKAVELGVNNIFPLQTQHSDIQLNAIRLAKKHAHWTATAIHACQQSQRATLPAIHTPQTLLEAVHLPPEKESLSILFDPTATEPLRTIPKMTHYRVFIGPEGGFSQTERETAASSGVQLYSLGKRILRAETAAISVMATLQQLFDET